ncbi:MAG: hypothetical protein V4754_14605 [Pseudomonadota bacterium]
MPGAQLTTNFDYETLTLDSLEFNIVTQPETHRHLVTHCPALLFHQVASTKIGNLGDANFKDKVLARVNADMGGCIAAFSARHFFVTAGSFSTKLDICFLDCY